MGFGKDLQEFLLRQSQVKMIIDNKVKRSFAHADVNTIIALLASPGEKQDAGLDRIARFVMCKVAFEQIFSPIAFWEIEGCEERCATPDYRVNAIKQEKLLEEGFEQLDEEEEEETKQKHRAPAIKIVRYIGNKWGGKYLRAPDIYWTILEKGKGKLVRLDNIAEVRFGIKTGANDFFYLNAEGIKEWGIEEEFVKPVLFSLKEIKRYEIEKQILKKHILICNEDKRTLKRNGKNNILEYINWGESEEYNLRPSVLGRTNWYSVPNQKQPQFVSNRFLGERLGFPYIEDALVCDVFFIGNFGEIDGIEGCAIMNCIISLLSAEILSRKTYGIGIAYLYGPEIRGLNILDPTKTPDTLKLEIKKCFTKMRNRNLLKIEDEIKQEDRKQLDSLIFDFLGMSRGEQEATYEAISLLIKERLEKAKNK